MSKRTFLDIIHDLAEEVESSTIPYQQKRVIVDEIQVLWQLLWPWTAPEEKDGKV